MDCSLPVFSHGIFKARILEWVAVSFSRRSSPPRDQTQVSCNIGRRFTVWATRVVNKLLSDNYYLINWDKRNSLNSPFLPAVTLDCSWGDRVLNSCRHPDLFFSQKVGKRLTRNWWGSPRGQSHGVQNPGLYSEMRARLWWKSPGSPRSMSVASELMGTQFHSCVGVKFFQWLNLYSSFLTSKILMAICQKQPWKLEKVQELFFWETLHVLSCNTLPLKHLALGSQEKVKVCKPKTSVLVCRGL